MTRIGLERYAKEKANTPRSDGEYVVSRSVEEWANEATPFEPKGPGKRVGSSRGKM